MKFETSKSVDAVTVGISNFDVVDGIVEVPDNLAEQYIESLKENGYTPIEEQRTETTLLFLTSIKGIGDSYGRQIQQEYDTLDKIIDAGKEELAYEIPGISQEKAEELIEKCKEVR